jgi:hypothetical protein
MALKTAQVTVGTTPVLLTGPDLDHRDGSSIAVQAPSAAALYIGGDSTVSSSTGWLIAAGQTLALDLEPGESVYGVLMSGTGTAFVLRTGV